MLLLFVPCRNWEEKRYRYCPWGFVLFQNDSVQSLCLGFHWFGPGKDSVSPTKSQRRMHWRMPPGRHQGVPGGRNWPHVTSARQETWPISRSAQLAGDIAGLAAARLVGGTGPKTPRRPAKSEVMFVGKEAGSVSCLDTQMERKHMLLAWEKNSTKLL